MILKFEDADSKEEVYFSWWLDDLMKAGYIEDWKYQPAAFKLSEKITYTVHTQLKTKVRSDQKILMYGHTYTPDFWILWDKRTRGIFYNNINDFVDLKSCALIAQNDESYIDVKPAVWGKGNSFIEVFKNNQKWTYKRHGVFVQPVVVQGQKTSLFETTFCPDRFRTQDKMKGKRKINFPVKSLAEFLELN